jgi:hypothetical protein
MRDIVAQVEGKCLFGWEELAGADGRKRQAGDFGGSGEVMEGVC